MICKFIIVIVIICSIGFTLSLNEKVLSTKYLRNLLQSMCVSITKLSLLKIKTNKTYKSVYSKLQQIGLQPRAYLGSERGGRSIKKNRCVIFVIL